MRYIVVKENLNDSPWQYYIYDTLLDCDVQVAGKQASYPKEEAEERCKSMNQNYECYLKEHNHESI